MAMLMSDTAVTMITAMSGSISRTRFSRSMPLRPGIRMSLTTRSKRLPASNISRASTALAAVSQL